MHPLERAIRSSDGILSTAELHRRGVDDDTIKLVVSYRKIVPIRRGWYASPDLPRDAFRQRRRARSIDEMLATIGRCQHREIFHAVRRAANR